MAKLEGAIEQQAKDSEQEQGRLRTLEASLSQQQTGQESEEKITKLLLALGEAKRRTEQAEKSRDLELARADRLEKEIGQGDSGQMAVRKAVRDELDLLRNEVEEERRKRLEFQAVAAKSEEALNEMKFQVSSSELKERAEDAQRCRKLRAEMGEDEWKNFAEQVGKADGRVKEILERLAESESKSTLALADDQLLEYAQRLNEEQQRRREAETQAAEREGQLRHLRIRLSSDEVERQEREMQLTSMKDEVRQMRLLKGEALTQVSAKEAQIEELHRQIQEEMSQRQKLQRQLLDKEHSILELKESSSQFSQKQVAREQVIEKEREVCALQSQLADELSKRQEVQYQSIEKDRLICELQAKVREVGATMPYSTTSTVAAQPLIVPDSPFKGTPGLSRLEDRPGPLLTATAPALPTEKSDLTSRTASRVHPGAHATDPASPALGFRQYRPNMAGTEWTPRPAEGHGQRACQSPDLSYRPVAAGGSGRSMQMPPWMTPSSNGRATNQTPVPEAQLLAQPLRGCASPMKGTTESSDSHTSLSSTHRVPVMPRVGVAYPAHQTTGGIRQRAYGLASSPPRVQVSSYSAQQAALSRRLSQGAKTFS
eukprot:TRINITY_DN49826_c0_g1_i1.p1 TRINITY_DN49826_c0_g1~~TRINITY_DN49826_c0_g1_i1.p1  ORF type:complete len:681 (+),score=155.06 TRINITY_DN49826_c0_g1_i1:242-2044(+)